MLYCHAEIVAKTSYYILYHSLMLLSDGHHRRLHHDDERPQTSKTDIIHLHWYLSEILIIDTLIIIYLNDTNILYFIYQIIQFIYRWVSPIRWYISSSLSPDHILCLVSVHQIVYTYARIWSYRYHNHEIDFHHDL